MTLMSLVAVVAPRIGKINRNDLSVFEGEKICYKMIYYIFLVSNQSSEIALESKNLRRRKSGLTVVSMSNCY